ncbi:hypothetical protein HXX01_00025 [Candidatus Nomurabacteria bacterium]|nr:hypothetical protein [Candidatus Nomurabacteria bacterium]
MLFLFASNTLSNSNEWGNLFAIWIMSCNDERQIMFYSVCKEKLHFENEDAVRELIRRNRELFRPISNYALGNYKIYYTENPSRFPVQLQIDGQDIQHSINLLNCDSAFSSQFRRHFDDSPSTIDIREWGVKYIEMKWKLELESRKENQRIWATVLIPFLMFIIALIAIFVKSK